MLRRTSGHQSFTKQLIKQTNNFLGTRLYINSRVSANEGKYLHAVSGLNNFGAQGAVTVTEMAQFLGST